MVVLEVYATGTLRRKSWRGFEEWFVGEEGGQLRQNELDSSRTQENLAISEGKGNSIH